MLTKPPDTVLLIDDLLQGGFDPFWRWDQILLHVKMVLRQQSAGIRTGSRDDLRWLQLHEVTDPDFVGNVIKLAEEIDEVGGRATDASIFAMMQLGQTGCPVTHSMRTAFVASLVAREQRMADSDRQVLICAALTMNIAMLDLQETLHRQDTPLTDAQRAAIREHPVRGRESLETFGVKNPDWLRAVAEHHEIAGGKGYPAGLASVFPLAEIIQYADTYCAMTRPRGQRRALQTNKAAYKLFVGARAAAASVPGVIVKLLGVYPPGTLVRLANGDIAVVLHRGDNPKAPKVASLLSGTGVGYPIPMQHETDSPQFAIVDVVASDKAKLAMKPSRLFGYEK
jgi:metal-sulfur cluster biosynthetic enzyme